MSVIYDCDMTNPECFSPSTAVPWETDYAALIPRFTGSISAISSALIIYIIMRSQTRLSSIYHRIMFGMSLADICGSIAMALTSLPMPSSMPKEEEFGYHWAGTRLGNQYTCNAQGFFSTFGMVCMFNYNAMLCLYYACAIAFGMREKNIKKYVEPILHVIPFLAGLAFSVPSLFYELYNPGISAFAWCGPVPYPNECSVYENVECIRGDPKVTKIFQVLLLIVVLYVFCIIFVALGLVVWTVIQTDRVVAHISKMYCDRGYNDMTKVLEKHINTKTVVIQAFSYITAFLLGVIPPLLLSVGAVDNSGKNQVETANILEKLTLVFLPLQGFFNFIIFVSFKVYNYRRVRQDVSICRVISLLFSTSTYDPCFISRISIVMKTDDENHNFVEELSVNQQSNDHQRHQVHEFGIHDESNDELHYRLGLMRNEDPEVNSRNVQVNNAEIVNSDIQRSCDGNSLLSFPSRSSSVTNNSSICWLGALSTTSDEDLAET